MRIELREEYLTGLPHTDPGLLLGKSLRVWNRKWGDAGKFLQGIELSCVVLKQNVKSPDEQACSAAKLKLWAPKAVFCRFRAIENGYSLWVLSSGEQGWPTTEYEDRADESMKHYPSKVVDSAFFNSEYVIGNCRFLLSFSTRDADKNIGETFLTQLFEDIERSDICRSTS